MYIYIYIYIYALTISGRIGASQRCLASFESVTPSTSLSGVRMS